jgi:hypothetical protein
MGFGFLTVPISSRKLGSDGSPSTDSMGVELELPHLSSLFLGPLLYFKLGIPSPSPRDVFVELILEEFFRFNF